ncbi:MAG: carboxy methyl transferase for protein phosphatase 2A [Alyxoria varia]|nr:MAG: carboxy methyl transferase for protein phosphatase 2A [Alyxoria varia]
MSAPQIPNLLDSLRASRSSRGRGGPTTRDRPSSFQRPSFQPPSTTTTTSKPTGDAIIQRTDDDAAGSRLSAVQAGYLEDDFAWAFMPGGDASSSSSSRSGTVNGGGGGVRMPAPRRMPVINRGTYVRCVGLDRLVESWIDGSGGAGEDCGRQEEEQEQGPVQVVSLGAGTDTRFFRFVQRRPELARRLRWHEVDFGETVRRKIAVCEGDEGVKGLLMEVVRVAHEVDDRDGGADAGAAEGEKRLKISQDGRSLLSRCYSVHSVDLRFLAEDDEDAAENREHQDHEKKKLKTEDGENHREREADTTTSSTNPTTTTSIKHKSKILRSLPGLDPHLPTLLLSECCLTYFEPSVSSRLLERFSRALAQPESPSPPAASTSTPTATTTAQTHSSSSVADLPTTSRATSAPDLHAQPPVTQQRHNDNHQEKSTPNRNRNRPSLAILLYEPLHPSDPFGRTMTSNLAARGISMPSVYAYPTIGSQHKRLRGCFFPSPSSSTSYASAEGGGEEGGSAGADEVNGGDVRLEGCEVVEWWDERVDEGEKDRLRRAEGLDEEEEWRLLAGHYGFVWGSRGGRRFLK